MNKLPSTPPWLKQVPNQLTFGRMATIPVLLLLYPLDFFVIKVICAIIFLLAAITDALDGYIARKYDSESTLGAFLDPIADKMLVGACLILLAGSGAAPVFLAGLLLCREMAISGLRLVALQQGVTISVIGYGKWKTIFQDAAIFCLLINEPLWGLPFRPVGMIALWVALGLSLYSAYLYVKTFWEKTRIN